MMFDFVTICFMIDHRKDHAKNVEFLLLVLLFR
jgi:hypothetical protein